VTADAAVSLGDSSARSYRVELALVFVVALATLVFEVAMTRIFSFKLYYYFTYLILGIAMLGLGTGGVVVAMSRSLRDLEARTLAARCLGAASLLVPIAYVAIARIQLNISAGLSDWIEPLKLLVLCLALFAPFLLVGIVLAAVFGGRPERINQLYFSDLIGAGLGCALCIPLFLWLTPPGAVTAAGVLLGAGALLASRSGQRPTRLAATLGVAIGIVLQLFALHPDPITDRHKWMNPERMERTMSEVRSTAWSSVFRVDVLAQWGQEDQRFLMHDGNIGSSFQRWDGRLESLGRYASNFRAKPFSVIGEGPRVLIIGAAGGQEIMASLHLGASHVTAVELNPATVSLLEGEYADWTGRVAHHPRVDLVNAEGRSFIERTDEEYDLIWMVAPDSYAAMNAASSGAFVLSESYLYTVEMLRAALGRLADGGVLCAQFGELRLHSQPNRTTRFLMTAREAMRGMGIDDFRSHAISSFAPAIVPGSTTLLSRTPFTPDQIRRYRAALDRIEKSHVYHPREPGDFRSAPHPVEIVINADEQQLASFVRGYPFVVSAIFDDSPFFWHFTTFRDALLGAAPGDGGIVDHEVATGERTLVALLVFATGFAFVFILLPTWRLRHVWREIPHKTNVGLYFGSIGLAFMFIEVCLIQKLTLFLGYPSYSLTVTLFGLLVFSGIGSLLSVRLGPSRDRALMILLAALVVVTLALQLGLGPLIESLWKSTLASRIVVATLVTAPIGLCLGCFMPIGVESVASFSRAHQREYVAWAWAINGFFSVVSSVLATILSMTWGFRWVLLAALGIYAVGTLALSRTPEPDPIVSSGTPAS